MKLFKFEIQKCGQILCAHKPYFLMLGHIFTIVHTVMVRNRLYCSFESKCVLFELYNFLSFLLTAPPLVAILITLSLMPSKSFTKLL